MTTAMFYQKKAQELLYIPIIKQNSPQIGYTTKSFMSVYTHMSIGSKLERQL